MNAMVRAGAERTDKAAHASPAEQYLTFVLGGETYAVDILHIKEILEFGQLTAVPMMPPFIRGVINLRGAVVPVIDLSSRFGGRRCEVTRKTCIVILELGNNDGAQVIGMVVDAVNEVLDIPRSDIEPPPAFGARIRTEFISGMARLGQRFVVLLDPDRVLSTQELAALDQVEHALVGQDV